MVMTYLSINSYTEHRSFVSDFAFLIKVTLRNIKLLLFGRVEKSKGVPAGEGLLFHLSVHYLQISVYFGKLNAFS